MRSTMKMQKAIACALLVSLAPASVTTFVARPAYAQSGDEASTKAARARFQEGVDAYDKGNYEAARASFLQAYALRKHPAVLLNLAQSSLRSGHHFEALKYFQQYLRESQSITPAQRSDADKGIAEARTKIGRLEISAPTGAEIFVDGTSAGTAPLSEPVDVEPGNHSVRAKMADGTTDTKSVAPLAGDRLKVSFTPPTGAPPVAAPVPAPAQSTPPPAATTAPPAEPPPPQEPATASVDTGTKKGLFSPPKSMAPVYIGLGVAGVGAVTAVVFGLVFKPNAQDSADKVKKEIEDHGGREGVCTSSDAATVRKFGAACAALKDNNDKVDTNALIGNIGIGVGVAGLAFAAGWYLFAPKRDAEGPSSTARWIAPKPIVGPGVRGLAVEGTF